jgi:hypothetical protein
MGLGSGIRKKPIPVPESRVKKAPDPGSGSATLNPTSEILLLRHKKIFKSVALFLIFNSVLDLDPGIGIRKNGSLCGSSSRSGSETGSILFKYKSVQF